jgi:tetratricopeptide (TPR) repeat protein
MSRCSRFSVLKKMTIILMLICFFSDADFAVQRSKIQNKKGNLSAPSEQALKEALRRAPKSFLANHNLGEFYLQSGQILKAIPLLELAAKIDAAHFNNQHDLILAYLKAGNLIQARRNVQALLASDNKAESYSLTGLVEAVSGNKQAAAEAFQRAAQLDSTEQNIFDYGNSILKLNAPDEALKIFKFGVNKFPNSAQLLVGEAISKYALGQFKEAIGTLCQAVDLNPKDERAYIFLGEMYGVSVELSDEINQRFERLVKLQPDNALAHYYYAMNLWKGKSGDSINLSKIEAFLKTATVLDPNLADAFHNLGLLYFEQQKIDAAIIQLQRAAKLKPNVSIIRFKLAQAYQRQGKTARAAQEFEATKKLKAAEFEAVKNKN